jgi:hypothetical protein
MDRLAVYESCVSFEQPLQHDISGRIRGSGCGCRGGIADRWSDDKAAGGEGRKSDELASRHVIEHG